ncbi:MAG TPA: hypothetical protein VFV54_10930 [Thermoanaerobaculia bacterium]|nr:hypothetical protein [Thermoanaerobaculia bacterium]
MTRSRSEEPRSAPEIIIATFSDPGEAAEAREALAQALVAARVSAITATRLSRRGEAEPIKYGLAVAPRDARRAIEALQQRLPPSDPPVELDLDEPLEAPPEPIACPECGSDQVRTASTILLAIGGALALSATGWATGHEDLFYLAAAIFALMMALGPNRRCLACGHRWLE